MSSSINQTLENYSSEEIDDVLIVGGGPVGLFLANAIKRFHPDASIRVIEKAPSNSIHSKALGIHARSMECLSYLGNVWEEFKEKSVLASHLSVRYGTTGNEIMKINFKQADTPFNYMTLIPQYLTEDILSSALDKLGVSIEREMEFKSFIKRENDLVITEVLNCHTNQMEVIKSRFVLGCDGGHSPIRHALGFPFKGNARSEVFLMGDVEIEEVEWLSKEPCIFSGIKGSLIYIPFSPKSNICRFFIDIDENDPILQINQAENGINKHLSDTIRYPLDIYQDYIQKRLPQKIVMKNPAWITSFKVQERLSSHYREGNIILLGDAAHVHSPFGGQGMNLGFQDAFNLSWKLGLILRNKGQNKEKILESYEEERRPIADETIETTKQVGLMFGSAAGWFSRMLREYIIYPIVSWIAPVIPTGLFENIMQLRVQYKNSSIIPITQNGVNSVIQPGYRAPTKGSFKSIIDPNMPSKTPLQCYTETTKHLLFLYLNKGDSSNLLNYETIISLLKDQFRDEIEMHIVWKHDDDQLHERTHNLWEGQWQDSTDETFNYFNFNQSAIVVVRPDGVIGLITSPTDKQSLLNYFNMFLL